MNAKGRDLNRVEIFVIFAIFTLTWFMAPPQWRTRAEAAFALIAAVYNACIDRGRVAYGLVPVFLILLVLAILYPPLAPTGPPPG